MRLSQVTIKNFKSIKEETFDVKDLNVLIGKNGSGKTNVLEFFKLMKLALTEETIPYNPFSPWWGFQNVVWQKDTELNISGRFVFEIEKNSGYPQRIPFKFGGKKIIYELSLGQDQYGEIGIVHEKIELVGILKASRVGKKIIGTYEEDYYNKIIKPLVEKEKRKLEKEIEYLSKIGEDETVINELNRIKSIANEFTTKLGSTFPSPPMKLRPKSILNELHVVLPRRNFKKENNEIPESSEQIPIIGRHTLLRLTHLRSRRPLGSMILEFFSRIVLLRPPDLRKIREPTFQRDAGDLKEDGSNLTPVLYRLLHSDKRRGKEIEYVLKMYFKNSKISFDFTKDGRIMLTVTENELELHPHGIADGFYKILFVLTGLFSRPSLLLVDEIENSLHFEAIQFLLDTIIAEEVQTIISTHSPVIVDMLDLDYFLICEKKQGETKLRRLKYIDMLKKKLQEDGLAHSEYWMVDGFEEEIDNVEDQSIRE